MLKVIKRILLIGLALIGGVVVLLVGAVVVDGLVSSGRIERLANTRIPNPAGPEIWAYVARPTTPGPHPAVIMIHDFLGLKEELQAEADLLAQEGYVVIAPDLFRGSAASWVPRGIYQVVATPPTQVFADLDAVFAWLATQPEVQPDRIAVMGFCFGGGSALRYSLQNEQLAATVIFYGSPLSDTAALRALPGPVLGIFGEADASIPQEQVKAFETALTELGIEHQVSVYPGQPHAFVKSVDGIQAGGAQGEAWAEFVAFLHTHLQAEAPPTLAVQAPRPMTGDVLGVPWEYVWRLALAHWGMHEH